MSHLLDIQKAKLHHFFTWVIVLFLVSVKDLKPNWPAMTKKKEINIKNILETKKYNSKIYKN